MLLNIDKLWWYVWIDIYMYYLILKMGKILIIYKGIIYVLVLRRYVDILIDENINIIKIFIDIKWI